MRVIFLDIDGVLNSRQSVEYFNQKKFHKYRKMLCPVAISNLRYLVKKYKLKVVVSSVWRKHSTIKELSKILKMPVYSKTPVLEGIRGNEIKAWLKAHPKVKDFVIVDDDSDMGPYLKTSHFLHCDSRIGLSWIEVEKAEIHFDKFNLTFKDLVKGRKYKLFSKPFDTNYIFDGKKLLVEESKHEAFFYPKTEKFAKVK